jgi:hypothetical protein
MGKGSSVSTTTTKSTKASKDRAPPKKSAIDKKIASLLEGALKAGGVSKEEKSAQKKKKKKAKADEEESEAEDDEENEDNEAEDDEAEEEDEDEDEDEEGEEAEAEEEEEGEEEEGEEEDDGAEEAVEKRGKTEKQIADAAKKRKNAKPKRRGYRLVARKGGFSSNYASTDASRDVAANIISLNEAKRLCTWMPAQVDAPAFDGVSEYKERVAIANEPLPPLAQAVLRANVEVFARKLMHESVQSMVDSGQKKVTPELMMMQTRKLQRLLKYSFMAPHGAIRHAQLGGEEGKMLRITTDDKKALTSEDPKIIEAQKEAFEAQQAKNEQRAAAKKARVA